MLSPSSCCLSNCCSLCRRCAKRKRFYCLPWISLEQVSWHPRAVSSIAVPSLPLGMDAASARGDVHLLVRTRVRIRPLSRLRPRHRNSHRNRQSHRHRHRPRNRQRHGNRSRGTPGCGIVRDRARPVRARVGLHLASSARRSRGRRLYAVYFHRQVVLRISSLFLLRRSFVLATRDESRS